MRDDLSLIAFFAFARIGFRATGFVMNTKAPGIGSERRDASHVILAHASRDARRHVSAFGA